MTTKLLRLAALLIFSATSNALQAEGNLKAGKEKAEACAGCHGEKGNSLVATFPKLAQQHASYLIKELQAFKSGARDNAMMGAMAMPLSDEDMKDIAAYYAAQRISGNSMPELTSDDEDEAEDSADTDNGSGDRQASEKLKKLMALGKDLYRNGNLKSKVSACIACHGPHGEGNRPAAFPAIHSQHADYLIQTLSDFKTGNRGNSPDNIMHMIAQKMTEQEIQAVSYHISMMK